MVDSLLEFVIQNKHRVNMELIKPAVDWRNTKSGAGTMSAAVAQKM